MSCAVLKYIEQEESYTYRTKCGYVLNADVNGALNILRKSKLIDLSVLQNRGCVLLVGRSFSSRTN